MKRFLRRLVTLAALAGIATSTVALSARADDKVIRIGFQKYGTLVLLKAKGSLEEKLAAARLHREVDGVPGRPAAARGAQCRRHRFRHHRRGAADLRPGRRRAARLCRLRAAGSARRGDPRAQGQPAQDGCRSQGQEGRAQQGLERPLPARQGAGEGRRLPIPTSRPPSCRRPMPAPPSRRAPSMPG